MIPTSSPWRPPGYSFRDCIGPLAGERTLLSGLEVVLVWDGQPRWGRRGNGARKSRVQEWSPPSQSSPVKGEEVMRMSVCVGTVAWDASSAGWLGVRGVQPTPQHDRGAPRPWVPVPRSGSGTGCAGTTLRQAQGKLPSRRPMSGEDGRPGMLRRRGLVKGDGCATDSSA